MWGFLDFMHRDTRIDVSTDTLIRYSYSIMLLNLIIKKLEKKKHLNNPKSKDLLPVLSGLLAQLSHRIYPHVEMKGYKKENKNKPIHLTN